VHARGPLLQQKARETDLDVGARLGGFVSELRVDMRVKVRRMLMCDSVQSSQRSILSPSLVAGCRSAGSSVTARAAFLVAQLRDAVGPARPRYAAAGSLAVLFAVVAPAFLAKIQVGREYIANTLPQHSIPPRFAGRPRPPDRAVPTPRVLQSPDHHRFLLASQTRGHRQTPQGRNFRSNSIALLQ
jgi:hypothetical protein